MYKTVVVFRVKNYFYVLTRKTIFVWIVGSVWTDPAWQRKLLAPTKLLAYLTTISRKVVGKNVHAKVPKGNMGYDQYTIPNDCGCGFCCFSLAFAKVCPWPPNDPCHSFKFLWRTVHLKTTHNCHMYFFRLPFSKPLYRDFADSLFSLISTLKVVP